MAKGFSGIYIIMDKVSLSGVAGAEQLPVAQNVAQGRGLLLGLVRQQGAGAEARDDRYCCEQAGGPPTRYQLHHGSGQDRPEPGGSFRCDSFADRRSLLRIAVWIWSAKARTWSSG